jgi:hypothetical protein
MNLLELGEDPAPTNADRDRIRFKTPKRGSSVEVASKRQQQIEENSSSKKKLDESFNNSGKKSIGQTPVSAKKTQVREFTQGVSRGASPFKVIVTYN